MIGLGRTELDRLRSILMNAIRGEWRAREAQDRIVKAIIDHG